MQVDNILQQRQHHAIIQGIECDGVKKSGREWRRCHGARLACEQQSREGESGVLDRG